MSRIRRSIIALACLLPVAGCSTISTNQAETTTVEALESSTTATSRPLSGSPSSLVIPEGYSSVMTNDGRTRTYRVVDVSNGEDEIPLVLVLHGFGGSAAAVRAYSGIESALAATGTDAVVVYPDGTGGETGSPQSWNAGGCCPFAMFEAVDDVSFLAKLIDVIEVDYSIDPDQVWVVGHSNGGMMAYRLACELSDKISAIGVAAGALMLESCMPSRAVDVLHLHGELDTVVPSNGGDVLGISFPSARQSAERYAVAADCSPTASNTASFVEFGCGIAKVSLVIDPKWTHDWQPDWSRRFIEFFAKTSRN